MMETSTLLINTLWIIIYSYLAYSGFYIFLFSIAGIFHKEINPAKKPFRKIAVLIPAYKEDSVIIDVANAALKQSYPSNFYDVIIIADSFLPSTIEDLKKLPIIVNEVSFEVSTKSKALNNTLSILPNDYELAVILDADNVMDPEFLTLTNNMADDNVQVIQGHRMAKNTNTSFAILDAISEEINNHIFRKGHRVLGLSSALIGSGMVFQYDLLKNYMNKIKAIGGFDKELELNLTRDGIKIHYLHNARVYDEKIQKSDNFSGQRRRWLSAQFIYLYRFFKPALNHLFTKGNVDFFDKMLQMGLFPRILLIGILFILNFVIGAVNLVFPEFLGQWLAPSPGIWAGLLGIVCLAFILSIPRKFYSLNSARAIFSLPKGFLLMFKSLLHIKGANKKFIHTQHGQTN